MNNNNKPSIGQYLTREQGKYVYKKTELGEVINTETLHQELEHERQLNRLDYTSREINPYKELIVNNAEKIEPLLAQMEQWSILNNMLNYIQYDRYTKNYHSLGISTVILRYKGRKSPDRVRFWPNTRYIKGRLFRHV